LRNLPDRIEKIGDVWSDLTKRGYSLKRPTEALRKLAGSS
jgi:hypothetical protein